jgi:hypothetical protein
MLLCAWNDVRMHDMKENGHPSSGEKMINPRFIQLEAVDTAALHWGDRIEGVSSLKDLDLLVDTFAQRLSGKRLSERHIASVMKLDEKSRDSEQTNFIDDLLSDHFKDQGRNARCNGAIRNFDVMIIPPDRGHIPGKNRGEVLSFFLSGEIYSTGRGRVGLLQRVASVFVDAEGLAQLRSRELTVKKMKKRFEPLHQEVTKTPTVVYEELINKTESTGLPTLGEKVFWHYQSLPQA